MNFSSQVIKMKMLILTPHKFAAALIVMGCFVPLAKAQTGHRQGFLSEPNAIKKRHGGDPRKNRPARQSL
jgi:hypothetical protein